MPPAPSWAADAFQAVTRPSRITPLRHKFDPAKDVSLAKAEKPAHEANGIQTTAPALLA
jgi:hypothetical protein